MAGAPKSTKTKSKRIKEPSPSIPAVRSGKTSSRNGKGVALHRSQTRTSTLSVGRSYPKVGRLERQKDLEHARSGFVAVKRNRSTIQSRSLTRQSRHTALKNRHYQNNKSSQKSIPEDIPVGVSVPKRSTSDAHSASRTSPRPNFVHRKSIQPVSPVLHPKETTSRLKVPVTKKLSCTSDRTHGAKPLRPEKRASTPSRDIRGAPASVKPGDNEVSPTQLATVTRRVPKRQDAEASKSIAADTKDTSSRSYTQVSRSSVRDVSLAFSVLAKPPCLMQSTVRPMIADSNAGSEAQHRNKGHDEWDNLEVWGLGRTSWRESVLANSKHRSQPDFDSRPGPRLSPEPVPQKSARLKFSMYNAKPTNSSAPRRKNARNGEHHLEISHRPHSTQLSSNLPATTNDRKKHNRR